MAKNTTVEKPNTTAELDTVSVTAPVLEENSRQSQDDISPITSPIPILPQLSVALGLLAFVFGVTYIGVLPENKPQQEQFEVRVVKQPTTHTAVKQINRNEAFRGTVIQAKSAFVWDVAEQRVLFNKNADDVQPLASITKLMTALVAYEILDPEDWVTISMNSLKEEGDSGFVDGERFTVRELTDLTLVTSSNDGAAALGAQAGKSIDSTADPEKIFVHAMNVKAEELGLTKTRFSNTTGLDLDKTKAGAYGSARDVAHLMEYIITNITDAVSLTTLNLTTVNNVEGAYHTAENTNPYVEQIDGLIASKTGYTALSGGNLVVAVNMGLNRPIVVAVLGSTQEGRFTDVLDLTKRARTYVTATAE